MGGKSKLARSIAQTILNTEQIRESYVEPFVGGGSVFAQVAPHFQHSQALDLSPDLILMWQAVQEGWVPPTEVSEEQYAELKASPPSALRGFVGYGGSFGGKWFGGYARGGLQASGAPRNHQAESSRAVMKVAASIADSSVTFTYADYRSATITPGTVVYCDPPYAGTQQYHAVEPFDSEEFWATMMEWYHLGAYIFVSEYAAPEGWTCIWEQRHRQSLVQPKQGRHETTERLWTHL